jgi:hypothetical protein
MPDALGGSSSGGVQLHGARVHALHSPTRDSFGTFAPDALTQSNPPIITAAATVSEKLTGIYQQGVLGGSIAFTRPDAGANVHGGPVQISSQNDPNIVPLGFYVLDANPGAYNEHHAAGSSKLAFYKGNGTIALELFETKELMGGGAGTDLTYKAGDRLYASSNGLATNRIEDAYEWNVPGQDSTEFVRVLGVVRTAPDASDGLLALELY